MENNNNDDDDDDWNAIRANNTSSGNELMEEERVEVNQRALIDKILARYASAGAVYRELLQNSNDAEATKAEIRFTTTQKQKQQQQQQQQQQQKLAQTNAISSSSTNTTVNPTSSNPSTQLTTSTTLFTSLTLTSSSSAEANLVTQVVYRNNGLPFRKQDWSRLRKIAEGNPNPQKVGAFGVGAYTMFSIAEEPMVISGTYALQFIWKGDALWTKTKPTGKTTPSEWTTFVLPSRDLYPLPDWKEFGQFLAASLTFTKCLQTVSVFVNQVPVLQIHKQLLQAPQPLRVVRSVDPDASKTSQSNNNNSSAKKWTSWFSLDTTSSSTSSQQQQQPTNPNFTTCSPRNLFQLEHQQGSGNLWAAKQPAIYESVYEIVVTVYQQGDGPHDVATIRARHVTATARVQLPPDMVQRMHRVTKKDPPATVPLQIYLDAPSMSSYHQDNTVDSNKEKGGGGGGILSQFNNKSKKKKKSGALASVAQAIAQSFRPPAGGGGRIFIGFRTSQTTGVAAHVAAPFLPTVEREAMDLQDATLRIYNTELLQLAGLVLRFTLQHAFVCLQQEWIQSAAQRRALLQQMSSSSSLSSPMIEELDQEDDEDQTSTQNEEDDDDIKLSESASTDADNGSGGSFMGFARFMARGMKSKIQSVVTTVMDEVGTKTGLPVGGSTNKSATAAVAIDYQALVGVAPDPRPLCREEVYAIHWMQSLCPAPSTPDPTVGTCLAQGFGRAMPTTPAPCLTQQGVVPANQARLPAHGMEAFCIVDQEVDEEEEEGIGSTPKAASAKPPPAVVRHVIWQPTQEYHQVIASQCRYLDLERDLLPYFRATVLDQATAIRLVQWWKPYSRILAAHLNAAVQRQLHNPNHYHTTNNNNTMNSPTPVAQQLHAKGLALKDSIRFYYNPKDDDEEDDDKDDNNKDSTKGNPLVRSKRKTGQVVALQNYLFYLDKDSPLGKHQHQQLMLLRQEQQEQRKKKNQKEKVDAANGGNSMASSSTSTNPVLRKDEEERAVLLPIPETVLPTRLQELLGDTTLSDAVFSNVWFEPLPMELWVEFMAHHPIMTQGKEADSASRLTVLTLLHQEYKDRASAKFRSTTTSQYHDFAALCRSLLANVKYIPYDEPSSSSSSSSNKKPNNTNNNSQANGSAAPSSSTTTTAKSSNGLARVEVPSALYLYSAELQAFEGVAGSSFYKVSKQVRDAGVSEDFLLALGVRKSVSIDFLFQNLDTLQWNNDPRPLIEYLKSATLTSDDWVKLSQTQYLPAEDSNSDSTSQDTKTTQQQRNYAPSELYLPTVELRIFPFLKLLKWPTETELSERSENGRFLVRLGMKVLPPLQQVLQYLSQPALTAEKRMQALDFVANHLNPSAAYNLEYNRMSKRYRFLPCTAIAPLAAADNIVKMDDKDASSSPHQKQPQLLLSPPECFSDAQCAVMGFPVLVIDNAKQVLGDRRDFYASVFQCPHQPEATALVNQLLNLVGTAKRKQQSMKRNDEESMTLLSTIILTVFASIFNYLSHRSSDISSTLLGSLRAENFIPCLIEETNKVEWFRVDQVFFHRRESSKNGSGGPSGRKDSLTEELFQVVEFSPFLAAAGVKQDATTKELFQRLLDDPKSVMRALGNNEKKYRALLRRIAADPPFAVVTDKIRSVPFLLAYTLNYDASSSASKEDENQPTAVDSATFDLAPAADIFIIDNSFFGRMFKVPRAPPETDLEDFYAMIGSQYISKSVERRFEVVGKPMQHTPLTRALVERVKERAPLLVSPHVTTRPLVSNAAALLDPSRLEFFQATTLLAVYSLRGITRRSKTTCFSRRSAGLLAAQGQRNSIYVVEEFDWFDVGYALGDLILKRCQLEDAFFISSLLDAPLEQLRARGFPVDRILQPVVVAPPPPTPPRPPTPPLLPEPVKPAAKAVATGVMQPDGTPKVWNPDGTVATDIPPRKQVENSSSKNDATSNNSSSSTKDQAPAPVKPGVSEANKDSNTQKPSEKTGNAGGMEEILTQMFPDADPDFIRGALGHNPSLENVRSLAEGMAVGNYPRKSDNATFGTQSSMDDQTDTASIQTDATSSFDDGTDKKKRGRLRKKLGRALGFGGSKQEDPSPPPPPPRPPVPTGGTAGGMAGMMGGGGMPTGGGAAGGPATNTRHEHQGPVAPAEDLHSQQNLERMLEQTAGNTTDVNRRGIEAPDTLLTSVPEGLDRGETCEVIDGQSLRPFAGAQGNGRARNGIRLFSSGRELSSELLLQNVEVVESFAYVLENLAKVFGVRLESMAIFNEPGGRSIAFNSNRALHFNLRFFHALHFLSGKAFSRECYSYWYITMAHELSHNLVSGHNKEHGFYTESFATHYLPKLVDLLANLR